MARKREERAVKAAYKKEHKMQSYLADDYNYGSFTTQLAKMNLELRDIPGDGNCLFRALGDQLEGHSRNHHKHRLDTVHYMQEHRADFEPFIEDDVPFERYVSNLKKPGTYAGNDAIVSFCRHHKLNVVIHQINSPVWRIEGNRDPGARELHISYHNGDHYSSVRRTGDKTETPSNIRLSDAQPLAEKAGGKPGKKAVKGASIFQPSEEDFDYYHTHDAFHHPYMNGNTEGMACAVRGADDIIEQISRDTGCTDMKLIEETFQDHQCDIEGTTDFIVHLMYATSSVAVTTSGYQSDETSTLSSQHTADSSIWSENGTGSRVFGPINGSTSQSGAKPKKKKVPTATLR